MSEQVVFAFGDSITMGLRDDRGGWPARLWEGGSRIVYNLGVDGNTSEDVLARFHSEARSRGANRNSVVIFSLGINDSSRINGRNRVDLAKYRQNMLRLIEDTRSQFTKKVFCIGLAPIDQSKSVPFPLEKTVSFFQSDRREYDLALKEVCDKSGASYVSLSDLMLENHISYDGVHPLPSGHAMIAQRIMGAITG
jgi:lysophospholipase L1-like esterase